MNIVPAKTLEEHRGYLHGIVKLKLNYLHRFLSENPSFDFRTALRTKVDIYRKTDANPEGLNPATYHFTDSPWLLMENAVKELFESGVDAATFERDGFKIFGQSIDARCERDFLDRSGLSGYQCGSLRHELALGEDGASVSFHIANAVAPHSIFEDGKYLRDCLYLLCDAVELLYGATRVRTHSWLNQNPHWLQYFPAEWLENRTEPACDVQWHYGFWGQFISSRGTLNEKAAEHLRSTGRMMYYPCASSCSIQWLREHLSHM